MSALASVQERVAAHSRARHRDRLDAARLNVAILERAVELLGERIEKLAGRTDVLAERERMDLAALLRVAHGARGDGHDLGDALESAGLDRDALGRPGLPLRAARRHLAELEEAS